MASPPRTTDDYGDIGAWGGALAGLLGAPVAAWDEWPTIDADFVVYAAFLSGIFAVLGLTLGRFVGLAYGALIARH